MFLPDIAEDALYEAWKRRGKHWEEYGSELLGMAVSFGAFGWKYGLGPLAAALAAVSVVQAVFKSWPTPYTGKLFHDPNYRSIFRADRLSSRPYSDS